MRFSRSTICNKQSRLKLTEEGNKWSSKGRYLGNENSYSVFQAKNLVFSFGWHQGSPVWWEKEGNRRFHFNFNEIDYYISRVTCKAFTRARIQIGLIWCITEDFGLVWRKTLPGRYSIMVSSNRNNMLERESMFVCSLSSFAKSSLTSQCVAYQKSFCFPVCW